MAEKFVTFFNANTRSKYENTPIVPKTNTLKCVTFKSANISRSSSLFLKNLQSERLYAWLMEDYAIN